MIILGLLVVAIGCWGYAFWAAEQLAREQERRQAAADAALEDYGQHLRARIHVLCQARVRARP